MVTKCILFHNFVSCTVNTRPLVAITIMRQIECNFVILLVCVYNIKCQNYIVAMIKSTKIEYLVAETGKYLSRLAST